MAPRLSRSELWAENAQFYRDLISVYQFDLGPMLDLLPQLERAGFFEKYYPSNSHEELWISTEDSYEKRKDKRMVGISYLSGKWIFVVYYQNGQGQTVMEEYCGPAISPEILVKIDRWLSGGSGA
jgi:hypothetical protein